MAEITTSQTMEIAVALQVKNERIKALEEIEVILREQIASLKLQLVEANQFIFDAGAGAVDRDKKE